MKIPTTGYMLLRWQVLERDKFTCQYCGQFAPNIQLEVDHIIPIEDGGEDTKENLRTACFSCNRGRSALRIRQTRSNGKNLPKPFKYIGFGNTFNNRQDKILAIIQRYPEGIKPMDIAKEVNINRCYINVLTGRLLKAGRITKISLGYNQVILKPI